LNDNGLYVTPVWLDPAFHRNLRIGPLEDFSVAEGMHAAYLTATEFPQASVELPIVFIAASEGGGNGPRVVSPIVLLGVVPGENLQVESGRWTARYIPSSIRRYPFLSSGVVKGEPSRVLVDIAWKGLSETVGVPLFEADDKPSPTLQAVLDYLRRFEQDVVNTQALCRRIVELGLLKPMQADLTLGDGSTLTIDGFQVIDDAKLQGLPDAQVLELHRSGMLALMQLHLLSLSNMRHLVDRKWRRMQERSSAPLGAPGAGVPAAPVPAA
jgi:hypothetical protein